MSQRIAIVGVLAFAVSGGAASQPADCFNDDEEPVHRSPVNDLQPPAVERLPPVLRVTDEDVSAVLRAIAEHERRRGLRGAAASGG